VSLQFTFRLAPLHNSSRDGLVCLLRKSNF